MSNIENAVQERTQRDAHADLIRVIAMLFVIFLHTFGSTDFYLPFEGRLFMRPILYTCNGLFFLLSGHFALSKFKFDEQDNVVHIKRFYWKRFCSIVIPFLFYSTLLFFATTFIPDYSKDAHQEQLNILHTVNLFAEQIYVKNASTHIWFMYAWFGMIVAAPFLARMLHGMSESELRLLMGIAIGWEFLQIILFGNILHKPFTIGGWPFTSWLFYFIAGYIVHRIPSFKNIKIALICSVGGGICNTHNELALF